MIDPQHGDWRVVALTASITTLIGASVGFIAAIASEVWKSNRTEKQNSKRLERALYAEMSELYSSLRGLLRDQKDARDTEMEIPNELVASITKSYSVLDSYKYAKQNPHQFYGLKYAFTINNIYSSLREISADSDDRSTVNKAFGFCLSVMSAIREKRINVELFKQASPTAYENVLHHIEESDRENAQLLVRQAEIEARRAANRLKK
jgi:hypothetical protein